MSATSFVIPFSDPHEIRTRVLDWILGYWRHHMPDAEFIIQQGPETDFSKTEVLNQGIEAASGAVIVALDADAIMDGGQVTEAITIASEGGYAIPYSKMFRLTMPDTEIVLDMSPEDFWPSRQITTGLCKEQPRAWFFGAMAQVYPKAAWEAIGGFDTRFRGWGSEDECMKMALDTMWAPSHILDGEIFHLEHIRNGHEANHVGNSVNRKWAGQKDQLPNQDLRNEYARAYENPPMMAEVIAKYQR